MHIPCGRELAQRHRKVVSFDYEIPLTCYQLRASVLCGCIALELVVTSAAGHALRYSRLDARVCAPSPETRADGSTQAFMDLTADIKREA